MAKAQNRADTKKWKEKRKNHFGDKCKRAKCGLCAAHKSMGNSGKRHRKKDRKIEEESNASFKEIENYIVDTVMYLEVCDKYD